MRTDWEPNLVVIHAFALLTLQVSDSKRSGEWCNTTPRWCKSGPLE